MTPFEIALAILGVPFLVFLGLMEIANRRWHRRNDEPDEG